LTIFLSQFIHWTFLPILGTLTKIQASRNGRLFALLKQEQSLD